MKFLEQDWFKVLIVSLVLATLYMAFIRPTLAKAQCAREIQSVVALLKSNERCESGGSYAATYCDISDNLRQEILPSDTRQKLEYLLTVESWGDDTADMYNGCIHEHGL